MSKNLKFAGGMVLLLLLLAVFAGMKLLMVELPKRGFASVHHVGYTNGPAGEELAVFIFTNASTKPLLRRGRYWLQAPVPGSGDGKTFFQGDLVTGPQVIPPGKTEQLLVPAPDTTGRWRLCVFAEEDGTSLAYRIRERMSGEAERRGWQNFPMQFRNGFYEVPGQWLGGTNGPAGISK